MKGHTNTSRELCINAESIRIDAGKNLDYRLHEHFVQACNRTHNSIVNRIVIDLENTVSIDESGLALLMMLHDRALHLQKGIELRNCSPALKNRLDSDLYTGIFNFF